MAQQPTVTNQSWDVLRQLQAGEKLEVERKAAKKVSGKFVSMSDTELIIERKRKNVSFRRDEVKNIWRVTPPSRKKQVILAAIGGGAGFFAGALIGLSLALKPCQPNCGDERAGEVAAVVGLSVGGVLLGRAAAGSGKRALLYSAP
jgi:hypothetical protein